jgi:hypothetical protein
MAVFVVDASVALAWCFEDEATNWTEEFLERLRQGDRIIVPAHWPSARQIPPQSPKDSNQDQRMVEAICLDKNRDGCRHINPKWTPLC